MNKNLEINIMGKFVMPISEQIKKLTGRGIGL
jgi:hypothetical protein